MEDKTILVVDDEEMILDTFQAFLELEGYCVYTANCVANAKTVLSDKVIKLVLTDLKMPGENGIEFLTYLNKNHSNIPVVMITGNPDAKATYAAYEKGIMDFLIKPISRKDITEIANRVFSDLAGGDEDIDELLRGLR
ncbi:MAG: response regulator [Candidatus Cloacimonetes bacterium]|nr:response regulator [Candidatus Cloacimonadota bacterium]